MVLTEADDTALGQQLLSDDTVHVRFADAPAGVGLTPAGLYVEHSHKLPAIFGEILSLGRNAYDAGLRKGASVLFIRYAGEITDVLPDGAIFAVFDYHDIPAGITT